MKRYPETFKHNEISIKHEDTLEKITGDFYSAFTSRYAGTQYYINMRTLLSFYSHVHMQCLM